MSIRLLSGNVEQAIGNTSMGFKKIQAEYMGKDGVQKAMRWNAIANKSECGQRRGAGLSPRESAEEKESARRCEEATKKLKIKPRKGTALEAKGRQCVEKDRG